MDTRRETVERKLKTCKTTKQVDGWARTTKAKASLARTKAGTQNKGKPRQECEERISRNGEARRHPRHTDGRIRVVTTLTAGLTQTGGRATGAQICGLTLHGNKRHDSCHRRNRFKNSPTQRCRCASCQLMMRDSEVNKIMETKTGIIKEKDGMKIGFRTW